MKLHVVATTEDGVLWHTIRHAKNQWDRFGDAKSQTGTTPDPGKALDSTSARDSKNNLHVLFVTPDGKLWHTIRSGTTGLWTKLGDVAGRVPGGIQPHETEPHGIGIVKAVAAATDRLDLHVLAVTAEDKLWYTIRRESGKWDPWERYKNAQSSEVEPRLLKTLATATAS